jgi:hypothetical protein
MTFWGKNSLSLSSNVYPSNPVSIYERYVEKCSQKLSESKIAALCTMGNFDEIKKQGHF